MRRAGPVVAAIVALSCGSGSPRPTDPSPTTFIGFTTIPSIGPVVWEYGPGPTTGYPLLTPMLRYNVEWTSSVTTALAGFSVRFMDPAGKTCFFGARDFGPVTRGQTYTLNGTFGRGIYSETTGDVFEPLDVSFWQGSCGADFHVSSMLLRIVNGTGRVTDGPAIVENSVFANFDFTRTGYPGGRPPSTPTSAPPPSSDGFPTCSGSRPTASCGTASGRCTDATFTCSQNRAGTCSGHDGLSCVYCPGPIC
jgi:hypothetical protein